MNTGSSRQKSASLARGMWKKRLRAENQTLLGVVGWGNASAGCAPDRKLAMDHLTKLDGCALTSGV